MLETRIRKTSPLLYEFTDMKSCINSIYNCHINLGWSKRILRTFKKNRRLNTIDYYVNLF